MDFGDCFEKGKRFFTIALMLNKLKNCEELLDKATEMVKMCSYQLLGVTSVHALFVSHL